jgi:HD superfamily phosphohydrolase
MKKYETRDPIFGFIAFNEWEKEIINSSPFQRLRRIRQLALTDMVYPGALYSRFEHSLGVMHLATLMFDAILNNKQNMKILENDMKYNDAGLKRDRQMIRLAALLHDIGHAPFSHASEEIIPVNHKTGNSYQHEDYSVEIINGPLKSVIEDNNINENNYKIRAEEISALIEGNPSILKGKIFWKTLISSQLDADRGDYLLRDSHHIGVKYGVYDFQRLLNTIALGYDPESNDVILGVDEGGWHVAEAVVLARYQMFTQVYFHKTRRAYDFHLKESLQHVLPEGKLPGPKKIQNFLKMDDFYIWDLMKKRKENPHCKAILERNHIRLAYSTPETPDEVDESKFKEIESLLNKSKIWYHIDNSKNVWYKMNKEKGDNKEVMIIDTPGGSAKPLSAYSRIAKNIGVINQLRIYVNPEDRKKTMEIIS